MASLRGRRYFGPQTTRRARGSGRAGARVTSNRKLIHFVSLESEAPLCGGGGAEASQPEGNGVAVCVACARRMVQQLDGGPSTAAPRPASQRRSWRNAVKRR